MRTVRSNARSLATATAKLTCTPVLFICSPYVVLPIPSSNLLLLVLDTLCPLPTHVPQLSTWPVEHDYNASLACHKARSDPLPRRRPLTCINKHANVSSGVAGGWL